MGIKKCDICGAECPELLKVKLIQTGKKRKLFTIRRKTEIIYNVCPNCSKKIIEEAK